MTLGLKGVGVMLLKPDAPILSLSNQCEPTYTLNWQNQLPTIDYFVIEYSANGSGWATAYNGPNISLAQTLGLGNVVSYRGIACRDGECSDYSNIPTKVVKPDKPTISVQATDDDGDFYVYWDTPFGTDGFQLKENGTEIGASPYGQAHITDKTDGSYTYTIRGYNLANGVQCWGEWSDPKTCVVTIPPPEPEPKTFECFRDYFRSWTTGTHTYTFASCPIDPGYTTFVSASVGGDACANVTLISGTVAGTSVTVTVEYTGCGLWYGSFHVMLYSVTVS